MVDLATSSAQGVAAQLAAVGQRTNDLQSQRVSERGKDIFQANLFSFGVIGDHNNPVSAVARPQLITAAGGYYTQTTALLPRAPPQPAQS